VEGVNQRKRHTRPSQADPDGGIITFEAPIHISNVMLIDPAGESRQPGAHPGRGRRNQGTDRGEDRQSDSPASVSGIMKPRLKTHYQTPRAAEAPGGVQLANVHEVPTLVKIV
jgi:hypothetical protein